MKTMSSLMIAALAIAASVVPVAGAASTAKGAICDEGAVVTATKYYSSGSYHGAIDSANGSCSSWNHRGQIYGSKGYKYYGGCGAYCGNNLGSTCNGGAGNYIRVFGSNSWTWSQMHINSNGSSASKTCDRCAFGLVGSTGNSTGGHVHSDNRKAGTKMTAWFDGMGLVRGSNAYCGRTLGYPTL